MAARSPGSRFCLQILVEGTIYSQQRGKEKLGLLISKFESLRCSRRLGFMNQQMYVKKKKKVDLCVTVCPVPSFGVPPPVPREGGGFAGPERAVGGTARTEPVVPFVVLRGRICGAGLKGNLGGRRRALLVLPRAGSSWPRRRAAAAQRRSIASTRCRLGREQKR